MLTTLIIGLALCGAVHAQPGTVTQTFNFTGVTGVAYSLPLDGFVTLNYGSPTTTVRIMGSAEVVSNASFVVSSPPDSKQAGVLTASLSKYVDPSLATGQVYIEVPAGSINLVQSLAAQTGSTGNLSVSGPTVNPTIPLEVDTTANLVQVVNGSSVGLIATANQRNPGAIPNQLLQIVGNYTNATYEGGPYTAGFLGGNIPLVNATLYTGSVLNISAYDTPSITGSYSSSGSPGGQTNGSPGYIYYNQGTCSVQAQAGSLPAGKTTPCVQTTNVGGGISPPDYA